MDNLDKIFDSLIKNFNDTVVPETVVPKIVVPQTEIGIILIN